MARGYLRPKGMKRLNFLEKLETAPQYLANLGSRREMSPGVQPSMHTEVTAIIWMWLGMQDTGVMGLWRFPHRFKAELGGQGTCT